MAIQAKASIDERFLTVLEVAERLKVNDETVRRLFLNEPGVVVICFPRRGRRVPVHRSKAILFALLPHPPLISHGSLGERLRGDAQTRGYARGLLHWLLWRAHGHLGRRGGHEPALGAADRGYRLRREACPSRRVCCATRRGRLCRSRSCGRDRSGSGRDTPRHHDVIAHVNRSRQKGGFGGQDK